jgi:hypothetical protein
VPGDPLLLLAANGLELAVGVGLVAVLGLGDGWRPLLPRLGLAYAVGLAVVGILDAELALAGVAVGLPQLALMALGSLLAGLLLRRGRTATAEQAPLRVTGSGLIAAGTAGLTALLLGLAAASFSVRPLFEWDGWAIWGTKAEALYDFGIATGPVFTGLAYAGIQQGYPLLLPALEATDYRAMGAADGSIIHLQLLLLAVAFAGGLVGLLWRRAPIELTCLCALAVLTAPPVLEQLASNYADIPLAFFVALGLVALARWLIDDEPAMLALAAIFFAAGALTKDEGAMFAAAAFIPLLALLALRDGRRALRLLVAVGAVVAVLLPWRLFMSLHHLSAGGMQLSGVVHPGRLTAHAARVGPSANALLGQIGIARWGLLVPLIAIALVAAYVTGRKLLAWFAIAWLLLSFVGMVVVYWTSSLPLHWYLGTSAYRIVATLVVGAAALTPLLAAGAWEEAKSGYGRKRSATSTDTAPMPSRQVIFLPSAYDRP